jgi:hypothetical protein
LNPGVLLKYDLISMKAFVHLHIHSYWEFRIKKTGKATEEIFLTIPMNKKVIGHDGKYIAALAYYNVVVNKMRKI